MDRREFLQDLGLAAGASIAFTMLPRSLATWLFPQDIIPHLGEVTPEWISAESLALLCEMYPTHKLIHRKDVQREINKLPIEPFQLGKPIWSVDGRETRHFGVDIVFPENFRKMPLNLLREAYLRPSMALFANQLKECKPKFCFPLELPKAVEWSHTAFHEQRGLDIRFVRMVDIGTEQRMAQFVNRFDICVA